MRSYLTADTVVRDRGDESGSWRVMTSYLTADTVLRDRGDDSR